MPPPIRGVGITSCRRTAATICPGPGLQRKRAAAALSQAGRTGQGRARSANTRHPAGRPHTPPADRMYATDVKRQTASSLNALWAGHNNGGVLEYSGSSLVLISEVTLRRTQLVLGWATVLACYRSPGSLSLAIPSWVGRRNEYRRKLAR